ncbi:diguanylate cyclase [Actinoplanes sp. NPDC049265]|uniref:tetratricopeptide repeat-containing diguanylate cyclase n=1 Tax=Actinoplanes sp. NPDC049265 TaxID=3363902 RepID=UPI0037154AD2
MTAPALVEDEAAVLRDAVVELEARPVSALRTLVEPATAIRLRAEELGETEIAQRARLVVMSVGLREGKIEENGREAHDVLAWAQQNGHRYLTARAHQELSMFYRLVGDLESAHTHGVECVSCLPDDVPPHIRARHVVRMAIAVDENGHHAEGDRRFQEALDLAIAAGDSELTVQILNSMAYTEYERENEPLALALVQRMRDIEAKHAFSFSAGQLDTIARIEMMTGDYDRAIATLRAVLDPASTVDGNEGDAIAICLHSLALACRLAGRYDEAQQALGGVLALAEERGLHRIRALGREEQAALFAATGQFEKAYHEHRAFHGEMNALSSLAREARAHALQAVYDAEEARRVGEHFREMAHRDALTGLYNRRYVNERMPALLGEVSFDGTPLSLALVDLDHFKRINDTLSHNTGDTVLQHLGQLLSDAAGEREFAARMGGEEFVLIFPATEADEAERRCEALRRRIADYPWSTITGTLPVTASIGITTVFDGDLSPSAVLSRADRNLYAAKHNGRNRVVGDD